eukprot:536174-Amphidinium_carterae.1
MAVGTRGFALGSFTGTSSFNKALGVAGLCKTDDFLTSCSGTVDPVETHHKCVCFIAVAVTN